MPGAKENNPVEDRLDVEVARGVGVPDIPDDERCDLCGIWDGVTGKIHGSRLEEEREHVVGDVTYSVRRCTANPDHVKMIQVA